MGDIKKPTPVKIFVAMLIAPRAVDKIAQIDEALEAHFGPIDHTSESWPFTQTEYYKKEMGENLTKRFVSFERLADPIILADAKLITNDLEDRLSQQFDPNATGRIVNLDSGYLTLSQIILATTKNYSHRIYIGKGIYAEMTLRYDRNKYVRQDWTYPDYFSGQYDDFFRIARINLKKQLEAQGLIPVPKQKKKK